MVLFHPPNSGMSSDHLYHRRYSCVAQFTTSRRGKRLLVYDGYTYYARSESVQSGKVRWCCSTNSASGCTATIYTYQSTLLSVRSTHNHLAKSLLHTIPEG